MIRILPRLFVTCAVLLSLLAGGALAFSWLRSEARGAVPLEYSLTCVVMPPGA